MQHLEVSGALRHIYIYIYVIRRLKVKIYRPKNSGDPFRNYSIIVGCNKYSSCYCPQTVPAMSGHSRSEGVFFAGKTH